MRSMLSMVVAGVVALTAGLAGCATPSLNPIYTTATAVADDGLVGTWISRDDKGATSAVATVVKEPQKGYTVDLWLARKDGPGASVRLDVHLVELGKQRFMDLYLADAQKDEIGGRYGRLALPVHQVLKVSLAGDTLKTWTFDDDWLSRGLRDKKVDLEHADVRLGKGEDKAVPVLTASTEKLQQFLAANAANPDLFRKDPVEFTRVK